MNHGLPHRHINFKKGLLFLIDEYNNKTLSTLRVTQNILKFLKSQDDSQHLWITYNFLTFFFTQNSFRILKIFMTYFFLILNEI